MPCIVHATKIWTVFDASVIANFLHLFDVFYTTICDYGITHSFVEGSLIVVSRLDHPAVVRLRLIYNFWLFHANIKQLSHIFGNFFAIFLEVPSFSLLQDAANATLRSKTLRRNCVRCHNCKWWCKTCQKGAKRLRWWMHQTQFKF